MDRGSLAYPSGFTLLVPRYCYFVFSILTSDPVNENLWSECPCPTSWHAARTDDGYVESPVCSGNREYLRTMRHFAWRACNTNYSGVLEHTPKRISEKKNDLIRDKKKTEVLSERCRSFCDDGLDFYRIIVLHVRILFIYHAKIPSHLRALPCSFFYFGPRHFYQQAGKAYALYFSEWTRNLVWPYHLVVNKFTHPNIHR